MDYSANTKHIADWDEKKFDCNASNGELISNYWLKHSGGKDIPNGIDKETIIEVETWVATGNTFAKARELNWSAIKFYRLAEPKKLNGTT